MRDRVKPPSEAFESFHAPRLSPAEGVESASTLFTAPPIESLELLRELGEIAAASISATEAFLVPDESAPPAVAVEAIAAETPPAGSSPAPVPVVSTAPKAPLTSDERLMEALLEYHQLRGPKLGARTAPRPAAGTGFSRVDASTEPSDRFSSVELEVVENFVPKTTPGGIRASRPVQTILKPKPRP